MTWQFCIKLKQTFNQAVKRNIERFPENFRFQLKKEEYDSLRSQFVTSKEGRGGRRYLPYVFTEQGIAMLSAVLRSDIAIQVSIRIMETFVEMRKYMANTSLLYDRMNAIEERQITYQNETNLQQRHKRTIFHVKMEFFYVRGSRGRSP